MRWRLWPWLPAGITQVSVTQVETLVQLYQQFQAGQIRLIMAFRHVEVDDPLAGMYLLSRAVPAAAQRLGVKLQYPLHAHFLYDRGMTLWGGKALGWMLSHLGGISIHRGKQPDRQALKIARSLLVQGDFPLVIAPEGATNGHSERLSPLEPGTAQLGFWGVEDLQKAGRPETLWILPIGLQYHYVNSPWPKLAQLISDLEAYAGLTDAGEMDPGLTPVGLTHAAGWAIAPLGPHTTESQCQQHHYQRLLRLSADILTKMERFYQRFHHRQLPLAAPLTTDPVSTQTPTALTQRLQDLLDQTLQVAEEFFGLPAKGLLPERCRRLEEAGWNYIYRSDIADPQALSPLDRGLADWVAQEASLRLMHMRLVESLVAVNGSYTSENPSFDRLAETTLLIFDITARIRGDKLPARPRLGDRHVQITIGAPISVSDRMTTDQTDRAGTRAAIAQLTQDIQTALENMIRTKEPDRPQD
jgi:1-acyl-sn-glycerol-3-phosphate acyltransferase